MELFGWVEVKEWEGEKELTAFNGGINLFSRGCGGLGQSWMKSNCYVRYVVAVVGAEVEKPRMKSVC